MAEVSRVRVEMQEQIGRLQAELAGQESLKEKVAALERQLKGDCTPSWRAELRQSRPRTGPNSPSLPPVVIASDHREALLDKESENASLREKLRLKEAEIARIRDEEAQRASFLQNAILTYVQGSPLRSLSPPK